MLVSYYWLTPSGKTILVTSRVTEGCSRMTGPSAGLSYDPYVLALSDCTLKFRCPNSGVCGVCRSTGSCCQLHHMQHVQSSRRLAHLQHQPLWTSENQRFSSVLRSPIGCEPLTDSRPSNSRRTQISGFGAGAVISPGGLSHRPTEESIKPWPGRMQ